MKKTITTLLLIVLCLLPSTGQTKWKFAYNAQFSQLFHNREFGYSLDTIAISGTLNRVRLTPLVGIDAVTEKNRHSFRVGYDFEYDTGTKDIRSVPKEPILYYDLKVNTGKGILGVTAGLFPRSYSKVDYTTAIFSHETTLADHVFEGLLLNYSTDSFYAELMCDWMEDYGNNNRERFQIVTGGHKDLTSWLNLGWQGSFFHYANYIIVPGTTGKPGVADNHILYPYAEINLKLRNNQRLNVSAGPMLSYQWQRCQQDTPTIAVGFESVQSYTAPAWSISNTIYVGPDLQTLWDHKDRNGDAYEANLYFGEPFYKGSYDCLKAEWTPRITDFLGIRLGARIYMTKDGFSGWTQTFTMCFNLENLAKNKRV